MPAANKPNKLNMSPAVNCRRRHVTNGAYDDAHADGTPTRPAFTSPTRRHRPRPSNGMTHSNHYTTPQRVARAQTMDSVVQDGLEGAVVFGAPRSPEHAERKRKARDAAFKGVDPLEASPLGGGPFAFYNMAAPPLRSTPKNKRGGISGSGGGGAFKPPSMVSPELATSSPSRTRPQGGLRTAPRLIDNGTSSDPTSTPSKLLSSSRTDREQSLQKLRAALNLSFGKGPLADRVLSYWQRDELDRERLLAQAAHDLELELFSSSAGAEFMSSVRKTCEALKLVRDERGVELVISGRIEAISDPRVERFLRVARCVCSVKS